MPKIGRLMFNCARNRQNDEVSATKFFCKYGASFFDEGMEIGSQQKQFIICLRRIELCQRAQLHFDKLGCNVRTCQAHRCCNQAISLIDILACHREFRFPGGPTNFAVRTSHPGLH